MSDTAIVDAVLGTDTPDPTTTSAPAPSLTDASQSLKGKTSWEEVFTPAATETPAEATPEAAAATETPAAEATPEPMAGFTLDETGRLHRADGTYASQAEVDQWNSAAVAAPEGATETATEAPKEEAAPPIIVSLKGRDGNPVEIEVTDEKVAEALRINANDGMRGAEYRKRLAAVEEREAQYREFENLLETNPEGIVLQHLPAEKQISLAVALLAQHWDQLAPHLVKFDSEPASRIAEAANTRVRMTEQERAHEQRMNSIRYAGQIETAVRALIPETTNDELTAQFMRDAESDITAAIRSRNGAAVPVDEVKNVLSRRLALYGFDKPTPVAGASTPTPKRPVARPVPASQPPAAPSVSQTQSAGAAIKRTVTAQRIAAATPPQGAGAAPVRQPLTPPNASIEQASQALRKQQRWTQPA